MPVSSEYIDLIMRVSSEAADLGGLGKAGNALRQLRINASQAEETEKRLNKQLEAQNAAYYKIVGSIKSYQMPLLQGHNVADKLKTKEDQLNRILEKRIITEGNLERAILKDRK